MVRGMIRTDFVVSLIFLAKTGSVACLEAERQFFPPIKLNWKSHDVCSQLQTDINFVNFDDTAGCLVVS